MFIYCVVLKSRASISLLSSYWSGLTMWSVTTSFKQSDTFFNYNMININPALLVALHSVSKETPLFFWPRVRVVWPWIMGNMHIDIDIDIVYLDSVVYTLLQKKGNFQNVALILRKSVCIRSCRLVPSDLYLQLAF